MLIERLGALGSVFPAPLAGVSDRAFRILVREAGCSLAFSEMVSDLALIHGNAATLALLDQRGENGPLAVQIFGDEPESMARAARLAVTAGAALIDINMGCPVPKVVKGGAGAALLRDPDRALRIAAAVVEAANVPVTVKLRLGWDEHSVVAPELAVALAGVGVRAVTVHGRTRQQFYSGQADWHAIRAVREAVKIPVIANGDVFQPEDAGRLLAATGCAGVMIGRGALGNPWIFSRTIRYLACGELLGPPDAEELFETVQRHLLLKMEVRGERMAVLEMRKHSAWYARGLRGAARFRERINRVDTESEFRAVWSEFLGQE
ncbi:MAG TPA: tRNA dihydrouridine synthase DusB [Spirochaetia bacterium]|nr:tRNA dihydrouridine synthase DusB [Spirochaetia bacterium]